MSKKGRLRKPEATTIQGICVLCGNNKQKSQGNGKFKPVCSPCNKKHFEQGNRAYRRNVVTVCSICNFSSDYPCQFDIDHIDGNHLNNDPSNQQSLCANCHRLKTFLNRDWE